MTVGGRDGARLSRVALTAITVLATLASSIGPVAPRAAAATPILELVPVVTAGLVSPVFVTHAGDARLFVVEQAGRIRIVDGGVLLATPFLDITGAVLDGGERGLLGLAFHPQYATNGRFFVFYTRDDGDIQISEFKRSAGDPNRADPGSAREILRIEHSTYANHNGGMLAFGPDGMLHIGTGDGGGSGDPLGSGQSPSSRLGKVLRIDINPANPSDPYAVPPDNPWDGFIFDELIWSLGLRNPWRFSFDRLTGDLWIGDVGQGSWEEINRARAVNLRLPGANYGWNVMEGAHCYTDPNCTQWKYIPPIAEYAHGSGDCSVTGGYVYRGPASQLYGRYLFGDYCSGRIWSIDAQGPSSQTPTLLLDSPHNIASFGEDAAGDVYLVAHGGAVFRLATPGGVTRRFGADRYATAAAVSADSFEPGVTRIYVATGENYPDALAGSAAAAADGGSLLLVRHGSIPGPVAAELDRLDPAGISVLGGPSVVSDGVLASLGNYTTGYVFRLFGSDRYATAAAISAAAFPLTVETVLIATGENYPDALAGGAAARAWRAPLLLVRGTSIPNDVASELARLKPKRILVLGGPSVISEAVVGALASFAPGGVTRLSGPDRYATAVAISNATFAANLRSVFIATGTNYPDALAGGAAAGAALAPLLLVQPNAIPPVVAAELDRLNPEEIVVLGGPSVVSDAVAAALGAYISP